MKCRDKLNNSSLGKRISVLGSGSYGNVYEYLNEDGDEIAVKVMFQTRNIKYGPDSAFLRETTTLKRLHHPNLINVLGITEDIEKREYYIITPVGQFDLRYLIYNSGYDYDAKEIGKKIGEGLNYLADQNIITGDLKPDNIIMFKEYGMLVPKIIDFGLSTIGTCSQDRLLFEEKYTIYYRAPELLIPLEETPKADAWVFGLILYELHYKEMLFRSTNERDLLIEIVNKLGLPDPVEYPVFYSNENIDIDKLPINYNVKNLFQSNENKTSETILLEDLIIKLLCIDPEKRFSVNQALNHPYFNIATPQNRQCLDIIRSYKLPSPVLSDEILRLRKNIFDEIDKNLVMDDYIPLAIQLFDRVINCFKIISSYTIDQIVAACVILSINYYTNGATVDISDITAINHGDIPNLFSDILTALDYNLLFSVYSDFIELFSYDYDRDTINMAHGIAFNLTLDENLDAEEAATRAMELILLDN